MVERMRVENVKTEVATGKSTLGVAERGLRGNYLSSSTSLRNDLGRGMQKHSLVHENIAIARRARCIEAADLLGLKRLKDNTYAIAGGPLPDLTRIKRTRSQVPG
jgi:hypothetical protein